MINLKRIIHFISFSKNHKKTLKSSLFLRSFLDLVHLEQKLQLQFLKSIKHENFFLLIVAFNDCKF